MIKYTWLLLLGAFSVQAAVYKCEQNGDVTFSQFPCSGEAETVDMRPIGTAMLGTRGEFKQQVDALKRQSRFVEYQLISLEQQKQQDVEALKSELYKLRRNFPKAEELVVLQQKIARTEQLYNEKIAAEKALLTSLQLNVSRLERQYAQN